MVVLDEGSDLPEGADVEIRVCAPRRRQQPSQAEREDALRRLLSMNLPVADWPQMEDEIIRGATG